MNDLRELLVGKYVKFSEKSKIDTLLHSFLSSPARIGVFIGPILGPGPYV